MFSSWCLNHSEWCPKRVYLILLLSVLWVFGQNVLLTHCQMNNVRPEQFKNFTRVSKAEAVLKYMNLEANPCTDFFDFACGQWGKVDEKPEGEVFTPRIVIDELMNEELKRILGTVKARSPSEQKVRDFYQSCVSVTPNTQAHKDFLQNFLNDFGGLQKIQNSNIHDYWIGLIARLRSHYGLNILIGLDIDKDKATMRGNSIYLGPPTETVIPMENCTAEAIEYMLEHGEIVEQLETEIADNMQNWGLLSRTDAERFGRSVVSFEFELCKVMNIEAEEPEDESEEDEQENQFREYSRRGPMNNVGQSRVKGKRQVDRVPRHNAHQLTNYFGNIINFQQYLMYILGRQYNDMIYLRDEVYLKNLVEVIKIQKENINNYIIYNALNVINFPKDVDQSEHCVEVVKAQFPKIIGNLYSDSKAQRNREAYEEVKQYFENIKTTLDKSLGWLSEQMKNTATQTLAQMRSRFVVYNNLDITNLRIENMSYWLKLKLAMEYNARNDIARLTNANPDERLDTIEAFEADTKLMPLDSEVLVGAALLQQPFYDFYYPTSMKYAVLGQYLARELVKAFDLEGWRPSTQSQRPLDRYTEKEFHTRNKCFRTQYSNYLTNNPDEYRSATRLREIIADSSGLNLAFNAYLNWLETVDNPLALRWSETLPNVDFTNTQLFFIHFAQSRCYAVIGEEETSKGFPMDKHTPERYDVNGPLSNFGEFAREFNCAPGDEMHPDDKCVVYTTEEN